MNNIIVNKGKIIESKKNNIDIFKNSIHIKKDSIISLDYICTENIEMNFIVEKNTEAKIYIYSLDNNIIIKNKYDLHENSRLSIIKFYNNRKTFEEETINLNGLNAKISCYFSAISENKDQYIQNIKHLKENTKSEITNRIIAKDNSTVDLKINSEVKNNIPNCELIQSSQIITLGKSNSTIKPNMYIDEHDVIAKHSSVISKFNDREIFYLMSRGISYKESIKLLIKGFLLSFNDRNMEMIEKVLTTINKYWR